MIFRKIFIVIRFNTFTVTIFFDAFKHQISVNGQSNCTSTTFITKMVSVRFSRQIVKHCAINTALLINTITFRNFRKSLRQNGTVFRLTGKKCHSFNNKTAFSENLFNDRTRIKIVTRW